MSRHASRPTCCSLRPARILVAFVCLFLSASWAATAHAARLRVRGTATFQALRTQPSADGRYQVLGYVRDGFDQPLSGVRVAWSGVSGRPCEPESDVTGAEGEFCVRVEAVTGTRVGLSVPESEFHSGAETSVVLDPTQSRFGLLLHLASDELDLTRATHPLRVQLESAGASKESYPVRIELRAAGDAAAAPRFTASATVSVNKSANFTLESEKLGAPGPVVLDAEISVADHLLARAEHKLVLVDTVELAWSETLGPVRPARGFEVSVRAEGRGGPVEGGWVEASIGGTQVGLGRVTKGGAELEIRFQAPRRERLPLVLRYVPEQPWYRAGPVLETSIEVLPPPWWAHSPWVLLAAVAAYWIIRTWRRPGRRQAPPSSEPAATGRPEAVLLRAAPSADAWTGVVVDAHTGSPIPNAKLRIEIPTVETVHVASSAVADENGHFSLARVARLPESARLVASAPAHSELRQVVPPLGELSVSLVERRRQLLAALTRWAKHMGKPWWSGAEPTPAHIAGIARDRDETKTGEWANEVERAAYGPDAPDEADERALVGRTPPLDRHTPFER